MFTEKLLQAFLEQFPDHRIEVVGTVVDGKVRWNGTITGPAGDGEVVVAESMRLNIADVPCAMADDLRNKLGHAQRVEDKSTLPASQRTALEDGIPGIVRMHKPGKEIKPKPPHGER